MRTPQINQITQRTSPVANVAIARIPANDPVASGLSDLAAIANRASVAAERRVEEFAAADGAIVSNARTTKRISCHQAGQSRAAEGRAFSKE